MTLPAPSSGIAAYLLGHGPYRSPRPIELQWMRILRYCGLIHDKLRGFHGNIRTFIDVNWPRAEFSRSEDYPALYDLLAAVERGEVGLVLIDIEGQVGFTRDYSWISYRLKSAGATVVDVFYDSENAFEQTLAMRYRGSAHSFEVTDASDFVAFYPHLSAEITRAVLFPVPESEAHTCNSWDTVHRVISFLSEQNPYAGGKVPFLQHELEMEWLKRASAIQEREWAERRSSEQLFRLAPQMPAVLLDEPPGQFDAEPRTLDELRWAEDRILGQLGFEKTTEERTVSYTRDADDFRVYADIRKKPRIEFYAYRLPKELKAKHTGSAQFSLHDRFTRDLQTKWSDAFSKVTGRYRK